MSDFLHIAGLEVQRAGQKVLALDQLSLAAGQTLAVIGPNGAGKSTLLLVIAGLLRPSAGTIQLQGQTIRRQDELAYRRRIGLVLQEPLLLDDNVFNNIAAGLRFRGLASAEVQRRVRDWAARLGIEALLNRTARRLSGGEAQRTSLARALVLQPDLLLLDEPFSALDSPTRQRLLLDMQTLLKATRLTTIFITHDLDEALLLGDQVAVLLGGRLRQIGSPEQVFAAPADGEVAAFVGVETILPAKVMHSQQGQLVVEAGSLRLEAVGELEVGRAVYYCLRPEDVTLWPADGGAPGSHSETSVPRSSARNRLSGQVVRLLTQGPLVRVQLDCGFPLMALVTRNSAQELGLVEGKRVIAAFKASAVHLIPR